MLLRLSPLAAVAAVWIVTGWIADTPEPGREGRKAPELLTCSLGTGGAADKEVGENEDSLSLLPPLSTRYMKVVFRKGDAGPAERHTLSEARAPAAEASSSVPPGRRTEITISYAGCDSTASGVLIYQQVGRKWRPLNTRVDPASGTATASASDFAQNAPDLDVAWEGGVQSFLGKMPETEALLPSSRFVLGTP